MKSLKLLVGLLLSFGNLTVSFAGNDLAVRAKDLRCEELQQLLEEKRSLNILSGRHDWGVVHKYYAADCMLQYPSPSRVSTMDDSFCFAGYVCLKY